MAVAMHERGAAQSVVEEVRSARTSEAGAAMLAGEALRRLRDERLAPTLGAKNLLDLLTKRLPGLDRVSADIILSLADGLTGQDMGTLATLGLTKLSVIAAAPSSDRAGLIHDARHLPLRDLRWRVRDLDGEREAAALRAGQALAKVPRGQRFVPAGDWEERRTPAEQEAAGLAILAEAERAWNESGGHAFDAARTLARLRDERAWLALGDVSLEAMAEEELGMSQAELERALALVDHLSLVPLELRQRLGIRALRELALVEPASRRDALLAEAERDHFGADELIARARSERLVSGANELLAEERSGDGTGSDASDDPARVAPFDVLFLDDEPAGGLRFEGVTPELIAEQALRRASRPGDSILDLTAGYGTFARVGVRLGRTVTSIDRLDPPLVAGISVGDARSFRSDLSPFDCVIFDPPTPGEVRYSERYAERALPGDLSLLDPESFARACVEVFIHIRRSLVTPAGRLVVLAHPSRAFGRYLDWPARLGILAEKNGFALLDHIVAIVGPDTRRTRLSRYGFRARQEGRTIPTTLSMLILSPDRGESRR
jgi:hypothetical protein